MATLDYSASFGDLHAVEIFYNTEADGSLVPEDVPMEAMPRTLHGPFETEAEATEWLEGYPDDTDVHDMRLIVINRVQPAQKEES